MKERTNYNNRQMQKEILIISGLKEKKGEKNMKKN
jgi:hypothetical protein